jgi:hypothetical protein
LALPKRRTGVTKARHFTLQIFQELRAEYANKVGIILKQSAQKNGTNRDREATNKLTLHS